MNQDADRDCQLIKQQFQLIHHYSDIERHSPRAYADFPIFLENHASRWREDLPNVQRSIGLALVFTINLSPLLSGRAEFSPDDDPDILRHPQTAIYGVRSVSDPMGRRDVGFIAPSDVMLFVDSPNTTVDTMKAQILPDRPKLIGHPVVSLTVTSCNNGILLGFRFYTALMGKNSIEVFIHRFLTALSGVYAHSNGQWPDQAAIYNYNLKILSRSYGNVRGPDSSQGRARDLREKSLYLGYDDPTVSSDLVMKDSFPLGDLELLTYRIQYETLRNISRHIFRTSSLRKGERVYPQVLKALLWTMITKLQYRCYREHRGQDSYISTLDEPYNIGPMLKHDSVPGPGLTNTTVMARHKAYGAILGTGKRGLPGLAAIEYAYSQLLLSQHITTEELVPDHVDEMKATKHCDEYSQSLAMPNHFRLVYEDYTTLAPASWQLGADRGEEWKLNLLPHWPEDMQKVRILQNDPVNKSYKVCFHLSEEAMRVLPRFLENMDQFYKPDIHD